MCMFCCINLFYLICGNIIVLFVEIKCDRSTVYV